MNNNGKSSGSGLVIVAVAAIVAALLLKKIIPAIPAILLFVAIAALIGLVILVIVVVALGLKSAKDSGAPKEKTSAEKIDDEKIKVLHNGRNNLVQLRSMTQRVNDLEVRALSNSVCDSIDRILVTLKEKPNKITSVRQFFNYYLPTLGEIIMKFNRIEKSGVPADDVTENVKKYLTDINSAMEKQYNSLFDDDILDMSVEMEAMTMAVKRDGLLSDEDLQIKDGEKTITLTV